MIHRGNICVNFTNLVLHEKHIHHHISHNLKIKVTISFGWSHSQFHLLKKKKNPKIRTGEKRLSWLYTFFFPTEIYITYCIIFLVLILIIDFFFFFSLLKGWERFNTVASCSKDINKFSNGEWRFSTRGKPRHCFSIFLSHQSKIFLEYAIVLCSEER